MPALSHFFNLKPGDFADMTVDEINAYLHALEDIDRAARRSRR